MQINQIIVLLVEHDLFSMLTSLNEITYVVSIISSIVDKRKREEEKMGILAILCQIPICELME